MARRRRQNKIKSVTDQNSDEGKEIRRSYLNRRFTGAFSALSGFLRNRQKWKDRRKVDKELRKLESYSLHRPIRRKFKRRRTLVNFINEIWQADLKILGRDMIAANRPYTCILFCIDTLSKKLWTRFLKDKTPKSVISAFRSIFKEAKATPVFLFTDQGADVVVITWKISVDL